MGRICHLPLDRVVATRRKFPARTAIARRHRGDPAGFSWSWHIGANLVVLVPLDPHGSHRAIACTVAWSPSWDLASTILVWDDEMSLRSTMVLMRLATLFFLAGVPFVAFFAGLYPAYVIPLVCAGALLVSVPLGLVLVRAMQMGREDEFAARYRKLEWYFFLAAAVSQVEVLMMSPRGGAAGTLGVVVSAGAMLASFWLLMKAAPVGSQ